MWQREASSHPISIAAHYHSSGRAEQNLLTKWSAACCDHTLSICSLGPTPALGKAQAAFKKGRLWTALQTQGADQRCAILQKNVMKKLYYLMLIVFEWRVVHIPPSPQRDPSSSYRDPWTLLWIAQVYSPNSSGVLCLQSLTVLQRCLKPPSSPRGPRQFWQLSERSVQKVEKLGIISLEKCKTKRWEYLWISVMISSDSDINLTEVNIFYIYLSNWVRLSFVQ